MPSDVKEIKLNIMHHMAGNRSKFSKHYITGSPIFSVNLTK